MSTWDGNNYYFSGQGVVLIGDRDSQGKAKGLAPIGNVSDLKISIATTTLEHKESQTGSRGIDLRLTTELKATLSVTIENFTAENLSTALRGDNTTKAAAAVTGEAIKLWPGRISALKYAKVSSVAVKRGAQALTLYTNDATPYDYKLNTDAGSVQFNDGSVTAVDKMTTGAASVTALTVGATTSLTVTNTASAGDVVALTGLSGADAAVLNGKSFTVLSATPTAVVIDKDTTGKTITFGSGLAAFDGDALTVDYSYAGQNIVNALTQAAAEKFLRFEGLNTADGNNPVLVEVWKFLVDPTKDLPLIGDDIGKFVLEGNVLVDPLQTSGSKYFKQTLLR